MAKQRDRAEWGTITRQRLVDAALGEIGAGRYEQLTIRSLADRLGVAPMSLYRHVESRDDLLAAVTDQMLADSWQPDADEADARAWIADAASQLRRLLVSQPAVLHVALGRPLTTPAALARRQATFAVLERAGFGDDAETAWAAVQVYVVGFAAVEAGRARWLADQLDGGGDQSWLSAMTSDRQFAAGLAALLDGLGIR